MRRILLAMAATAATVGLAIGAWADGAPAASSTRPRHRAPATVTVAPAATTSPVVPSEVAMPPPTGPFMVDSVELTLVDPDRATPARGGAPSTAGRTIVTTVRYPVRSVPKADDPVPRPAVGPFPLIVFAHGFAIDAAAYEPVLTDLAAAGYVVAAPDFPGTSSRYPGGANRVDLVQQPGDISFVISSLLDLAAQPGPLLGVVDANAIGVAGQSDGGVTAAAACCNESTRDPRIRASVILTGGAFGFDGKWFPPETPPTLFVHATGDEVNPYGASVSMFARAQSPKYLLTIPGGSHLRVYVEDPWEDAVAAAVTAFYDLYLKGSTTAADRLTSVAIDAGDALDIG